jgi:hypothetical protein
VSVERRDGILRVESGRERVSLRKCTGSTALRSGADGTVTVSTVSGATTSPLELYSGRYITLEALVVERSVK